MNISQQKVVGRLKDGDAFDNQIKNITDYDFIITVG